MIKWVNRLRLEFGASFIWLICLIYFTQGFRSFVWTAVSFQLKDGLRLSPAASQFVSSVAFFPWSIKPLYGILSDCIPIRGKKRVPYLVIATVLYLFPWVALSQVSYLRDSRVPFMIFLTVQNLGSAMADVVVDAMIAEAVRSERASFAGDLQSLSWMSMALGGIFGSLLGGYVLTKLHIHTVFLFFSMLPAMQLLSCGLVNENSLDDKAPEDVSTSESSHLGNGKCSVFDEQTSSVKKSITHTSRRNKNQKVKKRSDITDTTISSDKGGTVVSKWFKSFRMATFTLLSAFRQPIILRPMTWFFLANVIVPSLSTVMFYYQTEVLNLEASFLGTTRVVGWLGLMLGTFIYNRYLKNVKLRSILMWTQVGLCLSGVLDLVLISRTNASFGISDKVLVLYGSALVDAINQFKFMPFLILSGQLCPPGIEGTLFALFMSINNFGATLGSFFGAWLASLLNITSGSFDNLFLGIAIQVACTFLPVAFLFLIPNQATGVST